MPIYERALYTQPLASERRFGTWRTVFLSVCDPLVIFIPQHLFFLRILDRVTYIVRKYGVLDKKEFCFVRRFLG